MRRLYATAPANDFGDINAAQNIESRLHVIDGNNMGE